MRTVQLLGLSIVNQEKADVLSELKSHFENNNKTWLIATPNPEQIMLSRTDKDFLKNLEQMDWLMPDGVGLVWASRLLQKTNQQIVERITGLELAPRLIEMARENKRPVLIVGGRKYEGKTIDLNYWSGSKNRKWTLTVQNDKWINDQRKRGKLFQETEREITSKLKVVIPSTEILENSDLEAENVQTKFRIWWCQGYEKVATPTREEENFLEKMIAKLRPAVIFVALGAPHQEKWLISRRDFLSAHAVLIGLTVGGAFDVLTGQIPRAPQSWQNLGLEWLWRLIQEPHRWRRQLALIEFVGLILKTKFNLS